MQTKLSVGQLMNAPDLERELKVQENGTFACRPNIQGAQPALALVTDTDITYRLISEPLPIPNYQEGWSILKISAESIPLDAQQHKTQGR